ncbi:hypothetical protein NM952_08590 [Pasteurella multocida subsp. multocida]|uniref:Uncharacterized protein n=1 Tax=Pasteurella multocida TaxID=747 RepID=A0A9X3ZLP1_PASMD|nr:hypothetical protein [Pasteurella multocida]ESQ72092.1 hypothetical protein P1062_0200730 [Pasteurella multocida subsp. multocida P1062]MBF6981120.1 hypothetical protein [Pasteurella multocida]MBF6984968.1 hypothetical protein [Pasteurella multocida]MCL7842328.1 hypothetical protein [Pasteurella multocida]MCT8984581.1 hypothetical protein [Pasteurella multocida]
MQQTITNEQLFKKICEVQQALFSQEKRGLWTIQDVADFCGFSYHHTYREIVSDPRFPAPVDIAGRTGGKSKNLFLKDEVIEFFSRNKKKKNRA